MVQIDGVERCLGPKEVGQILGVSERLARRLMSQGELESFPAGRKLLRTTPAKVRDYQARQFNRRRLLLLGAPTPVGANIAIPRVVQSPKMGEN